jgi:hypothetical protein
MSIVITCFYLQWHSGIIFSCGDGVLQEYVYGNKISINQSDKVPRTMIKEKCSHDVRVLAHIHPNASVCKRPNYFGSLFHINHASMSEYQYHPSTAEKSRPSLATSPSMCLDILLTSTQNKYSDWDLSGNNPPILLNVQFKACLPGENNANFHCRHRYSIFVTMYNVIFACLYITVNSFGLWVSTGEIRGTYRQMRYHFHKYSRLLILTYGPSASMRIYHASWQMLPFRYGNVCK